MKRVMLPSVRCKAIDSTFSLLFWVADFSGFASVSFCSTWFGVLLRKEFFLNIFLPFPGTQGSWLGVSNVVICTFFPPFSAQTCILGGWGAKNSTDWEVSFPGIYDSTLHQADASGWPWSLYIIQTDTPGTVSSWIHFKIDKSCALTRSVDISLIYDIFSSLNSLNPSSHAMDYSLIRATSQTTVVVPIPPMVIVVLKIVAWVPMIPPGANKSHSREAIWHSSTFLDYHPDSRLSKQLAINHWGISEPRGNILVVEEREPFRDIDLSFWQFTRFRYSSYEVVWILRMNHSTATPLYGEKTACRVTGECCSHMDMRNYEHRSFSRESKRSGREWLRHQRLCVGFKWSCKWVPRASVTDWIWIYIKLLEYFFFFLLRNQSILAKVSTLVSSFSHNQWQLVSHNHITRHTPHPCTAASEPWTNKLSALLLFWALLLLVVFGPRHKFSPKAGTTQAIRLHCIFRRNTQFKYQPYTSVSMTPSKLIHCFAFLGILLALLLSRYQSDTSILIPSTPPAMSSGLKSVAYFVNWVS